MLYLTVFLSGAILMSLEMVGSRILAPSFGSSIYIWGSLIVVVMAALTLGYYGGGRLADRRPDLGMLGLILGLAGVYVGFLPFWSTPVNILCSGFGPRTGSLLAALAFFFLPSLLLATISPFAIKLATSNLTTIGNTAGHLSAISSAGSIIGTLLTSFFLIPAIGVRNIVHSLGALLLGLALLILVAVELERRRTAGAPEAAGSRAGALRRWRIFLVLLALALLGFFWRSTPQRTSFYTPEEIRYERDSLYHHVIVAQVGTRRNLHFDNSYQSAMDLDQPLEMVFGYTSYLHLGVVAVPEPERMLFIGLGGGSAPKKFLHDYPSLKQVDVVEIDPEVVRVARDYFALPRTAKLRVYTQDGRLFVDQRAGAIAAGKIRPYDLVVIDAYSESTIPYHLATYQFFRSVRRVLDRDGAVVSNVIGAIKGSRSGLLRAMGHTYAAVFPQVYLFPVGIWDESDSYERNMILIATRNPRRWSPRTWRDRAEALFRAGRIREDVPSYAQTLVDEPRLRKNGWYEGLSLLTDDYAPVDTLQNPLL
ncbi:spermidine synthase [Hydrogenispora ethanolica]|uniref:Polyamine aminopropyltransferase n=1 Tax=Hydrogenispora ethanolica TaxID=1082276 RepID=A0A4V2QFU8_HYDET|nr:fused MFS/spermidine synthase [Hydrogenispora ethanolica]TCL73327.1 spermidine synthase [Hydrogenispora ethanolica]